MFYRILVRRGEQTMHDCVTVVGTAGVRAGKVLVLNSALHTLLVLAEFIWNKCQ